MLFLQTAFFVLSLVVAETATKPVVIPLDQIWALEMPGTKKIRELDNNVPTGLPTEEWNRRSLIRQIKVPLSNRDWLKDNEQAGPAFVVVGNGRGALEAAAKVFQKVSESNRFPDPIAPANKELTLLFYSYLNGKYVRLRSVEVKSNLIVVKYRFEHHITQDMTSNFAMIPLGKLPEGVVKVKIEQTPPLDANGVELTKPDYNARQFISDSFTFRVTP